ncbi:hypothetical protein K501DRAFT_331456 [Backusella circina FSU 941]|nr:hypothetical protein K501DRAFT_338873 [Backusella circina FSU 941]KAI8886187.1 hypothetical protein K501DRAFT_331456 [Backusella circina FSU 941]
MSNFASSSTQIEGVQTTAINQPENNLGARKRSLTGEFSEKSSSGKKRRVNDNNGEAAEQRESTLPSPPHSPKKALKQKGKRALKSNNNLNYVLHIGNTNPSTGQQKSNPATKRRRRKRHVFVDAVPEVSKRQAALRTEKQKQERESRYEARVRRQIMLEEEKKRAHEEEEEEEDDEEEDEQLRSRAEAEFLRILQLARPLLTGQLFPDHQFSDRGRELRAEMLQFTNDLFVPTVRHAEEETEGSQGGCSICLEQFHHNEQVAHIIGCSHEFHRECIYEWITHNDSCPICRNPTGNIAPFSQ